MPRELRLELPRHIATRPRRRRSNRPIAPAAGVESPRLSHKGPSTNWGRRPVGGGGRSCPGRVVAGGGGDAVLQTPSGPFTAVTSSSAEARRGLAGVISSMTGRMGDRLRERPPRSGCILRLRAAGGGRCRLARDPRRGPSRFSRVRLSSQDPGHALEARLARPCRVGTAPVSFAIQDPLCRACRLALWARLSQGLPVRRGPCSLSLVSGCPLGARVTLSRLGSHDRVASARL